MIEIDIVILPHGEGLDLPARATAGAAGYDLHAAVEEPVVIPPGRWAVIPTGLAMAIPEGWEGQVRPRSGLAVKFGVTVLNAPGTIDSDYRGEVKVPLINHGEEPFVVQRDARIAQMVFSPVPEVTLRRAYQLGGSTRGGSGFGSTG